MKNWTLGRRIASAGCLIIVTVGMALFYFISRGFSKDMAFTVLEQEGNRYQHPLEELLKEIPQHGLLARRALSGQHDALVQLSETERRIDVGLQDLKEVDSQLGKDLQFTPDGLAQRKRTGNSWQDLKRQWDSLKASESNQTVAASDQAHEQLTTTVRTMITHAGDTSNLILDSDLDSYYLMDVTLGALPQTQERLAAIAKLGQDALSSGRVSDENRTQLAVSAALLKQGEVDRITGDVQTSLNEDPNFHGTSKSLQEHLPPAVDRYIKTNQALLDLLQKIVAAPDAPPSTATFATTVEDARTASFELSEVGAKELHGLLQMRIDDLASMRLWALVWTTLALLVSFGAAAWVILVATRSLGAHIRELSEGAKQIADAASQVSFSSQSLAQGASEQAASLEETAASSEQINSMAHKNTENAVAMAQMMGESKSEFDNTSRQLNEMMVAMDEINNSSSKIAKIIKIIDEIAFQTNILALNAAVEAARAGEAGMGFAVVADEVRSLAQRSAQAAKDTAELIEDSVTKSVAGKTKLSGVVTSIQRISTEFTNLGTLVDEVSHGSKEQSTGIGQIGRALSQMEQVTQSTAASAEESAAAAEELTAQSESMKELTERLNQIVGATPDSGLSPHPHPIASRVKTVVPVQRKSALAAPLSRNRSQSRSKAAISARESFPGEESFSSF